MSLHGNIKFIAKNLIFEPQKGLLGKRLKINRRVLSPILERRIQSEVRQFCDYDMNLKRPSARKLVIKKYGLLDLEFELRNVQKQKCDHPFQILRNENVLKKDESASPEYKEDAMDMMNFLLEEDIQKIREGKLYLKIFAEAKGDFKSEYATFKESDDDVIRKYHKNPGKVEFEITDACITNLPGIWFNKHFYW